jgi:hypothetical protein
VGKVEPEPNSKNGYMVCVVWFEHAEKEKVKMNGKEFEMFLKSKWGKLAYAYVLFTMPVCLIGINSLPAAIALFIAIFCWLGLGIWIYEPWKRDREKKNKGK